MILGMQVYSQQEEEEEEDNGALMTHFPSRWPARKAGSQLVVRLLKSKEPQMSGRQAGRHRQARERKKA